MKPYLGFTIFVFFWCVFTDPIVLERCILNILETSLITIKMDNKKGKIGKNSSPMSKINLSGFEDEDTDKPKENSDIEDNNKEKNNDNSNSSSDITSHSNKSRRGFKKKLSNIVASALGKSGKYSVNPNNKKSRLSKFKKVLRSKPSSIIPSPVPLEDNSKFLSIPDLSKTEKYLKPYSASTPNLLHIKDIEEDEVRNRGEYEEQNEEESQEQGEEENQEQDEEQNKGATGMLMDKLKLTKLLSHKDIHPKSDSSSNKYQMNKFSSEYNLKCQESKLDSNRAKLAELIFESKKREDEIKKIKQIKDLHCRLCNFEGDDCSKCSEYQNSMNLIESQLKIIKQKELKIEEYINECLELFVKQLNSNYKLEFSRGINPTKCEMEDIFILNKSITRIEERIILSKFLSEKLNLKNGKCKKCLSKKFNNQTCLECSLILEIQYKSNKEKEMLKKELRDLRYRQASCINYILITETQDVTKSKS
ncbi:hypothetical protein ACR3K2_32040 [Cryptosporidium serpentis]